MVRQETERAIREEIAYLHEKRNALIGKRRRLDEQIAKADAEIKKAEDFLGPPASLNSRRGRSAKGTATAALVYDLLVETGQPLHFREIYDRLRRREPQPPQSSDPAATLLARYSNDPRFYRTAPGTYALREIDASSQQQEGKPSGKRLLGYTLLGTHYDAHRLKDVLIGVCTTLHDLDPDAFRSVLTAADTRRHFSDDHRKPEAGADRRSPYPIANSGIFVRPKLDAGRVERLCRAVIQVVGLDPSDFAIETE